MSNLSVVVPAYNEENIQETMSQLDSLDEFSFVSETYLVDDCSTKENREAITDYLENNETRIKTVTMLENSNKVGAIEEAVRHTNSDYALVMDADLRIDELKNVEYAVNELEENSYDALSFKVWPDYEDSTLVGSIIDRLHDLDYASKRNVEQATSNVFSMNGGALYRTDVLEESLDRHSGIFSGEDSELASILNFELDCEVAYSDEISFETETPSTSLEHLEQKKRWEEGASRTFSEHRDEYFSEMLSFSPVGKSLMYKGAKSAFPYALTASLSAAALTDNPDLAIGILGASYVGDLGHTLGHGFYSQRNNQLKDENAIKFSPLKPLQHGVEFLYSNFSSLNELPRNLVKK